MKSIIKLCRDKNISKSFKRKINLKTKVVVSKKKYTRKTKHKCTP